MNKYQKTLECIGNIDLDTLSNGYDSPKYLKDLFYGEYKLLQELVDKATPKKPVLDEIWEEDYTTIYDEYGFVSEASCVCLNCGKYAIYNFDYSIKFKHCHNCGQAIDWSDEDVD